MQIIADLIAAQYATPIGHLAINFGALLATIAAGLFYAFPPRY